MNDIFLKMLDEEYKKFCYSRMLHNKEIYEPVFDKLDVTDKNDLLKMLESKIMDSHSSYLINIVKKSKMEISDDADEIVFKNHLPFLNYKDLNSAQLTYLLKTSDVFDTLYNLSLDMDIETFFDSKSLSNALDMLGDFQTYLSEKEKEL